MHCGKGWRMKWANKNIEPIIELPMSISAIGIKCLGSYQGEILTATSKKYRRLDKVPDNIEIAMILFRVFESFVFVLLEYYKLQTFP
ncbi:MAG: hypothetical protein K0R80_911 [Clostridia bacterium]|nr:hypothetical protein [Clostridia bacterium]